jgi:hypothetical protein
MPSGLDIAIALGIADGSAIVLLVLIVSMMIEGAKPQNKGD